MYDWWAFKSLDIQATWTISVYSIVESERYVEQFLLEDFSISKVAVPEMQIWPPVAKSKKHAFLDAMPLEDDVVSEDDDVVPGLGEHDADDVEPEAKLDAEEYAVQHFPRIRSGLFTT